MPFPLRSSVSGSLPSTLLPFPSMPSILPKSGDPLTYAQSSPLGSSGLTSLSSALSRRNCAWTSRSRALEMVSRPKSSSSGLRMPLGNPVGFDAPGMRSSELIRRFGMTSSLTRPRLTWRRPFL